MAEFSKKYPGVEMEVQEETTQNLIKLLLASELDFALASQPIQNGKLEVRELFSEELLLALPHGHPLTRKKAVRVSDLESEKFILMKEGHCLGDQVLNFCERRDMRPCISFRSSQLETIQSLVSAGMGLSLIPAMAAQSDRDDLPKYRPLTSPRPQRKIVAVWLKQRRPSRAAEEFLKLIPCGRK